MVRETGFIKPGDDVKEVGVSQQFEEAIAPLNNPNDVGERTGIKNGFAIPMLVEKRDPRIPDFGEVRDKVIAAVKLERAKSQLEDKAKELIANSKNPGDLKAAAEKLGLEAKAEASYKIATPLGEAGSSVVIDDAIYSMNTGDVSKTPVKLNENYMVFGVTKRTDADLAEFAKQRDSLMQSALTDRKSQVFSDYLAAVQQKMQAAGQIKIYQDVLDRFTEEEPSAAPAPVQRSRTRPQIPITK
jgi:peptidyl-prolyl cis-trans isomerase D